MKVKLTDEFVAKGKCPRCNYAEARWWKLIGLSSDGHTEQFHYWFECPASFFLWLFFKIG